jgi:hypothetical protein
MERSESNNSPHHIHLTKENNNVAKNMTRPGGETSENPTRTWGIKPNANTNLNADAQPIARVAKVTTSQPTAKQPKQGQTARLPADRDYGGDGYPLGGSYADPSRSPLLGKN